MSTFKPQKSYTLIFFTFTGWYYHHNNYQDPEFLPSSDLTLSPVVLNMTERKNANQNPAMAAPDLRQNWLVNKLTLIKR